MKKHLQQFQHTTPIDPIFLELKAKIEALKLERSPYETLPIYHFNELAKGIPCQSCDNFITQIEGKRCVCLFSGREEKLQSAILRNIHAFTLLFPDQPVTRNAIYQWCGELDLKRRISYVLHHHFTKRNNTKGAYYKEKNPHCQ